MRNWYQVCLKLLTRCYGVDTDCETEVNTTGLLRPLARLAPLQAHTPSIPSRRQRAQTRSQQEGTRSSLHRAWLFLLRDWFFYCRTLARTRLIRKTSSSGSIFWRTDTIQARWGWRAQARRAVMGRCHMWWKGTRRAGCSRTLTPSWKIVDGRLQSGHSTTL